MESVSKLKNSNKIPTTEHLTKSTYHKTKTEATEINKPTSTPTKNITEKQLLKAFIIRLMKKIRMLQLRL